VELPRDLSRALTAAAVRDVFAKLAYTDRRKEVAWVTAAKREDTRAKRVASVVDSVKARKKSVP